MGVTGSLIFVGVFVNRKEKKEMPSFTLQAEHNQSANLRASDKCLLGVSFGSDCK